MEKIYLISNPLTIPDNFQHNYPLSYNFWLLQRSLQNRGIKLVFVKQDNNYVYVRALKSGKKSRIIEISYNELEKCNVAHLYNVIKGEL